MQRSKRQGFTLIELAIVLVIIGMIVGGVLAGRELIKAAEIRNLIKQIEDIQAAVNTFRLKYNAYPGDMHNAEAIWGSDADCPNTVADLAPKQVTCNGNGDRKIGDTVNNSTVASLRYEWFRAWQQMANAGILKGSYTGVLGPGLTRQHIPGVNCPAAAAPGVCSMLYYYFHMVGSADVYPLLPGHYLQVGTPNTTNGMPSAAAFSPADVQHIDVKLDDGFPGSNGKLSSFRPGSVQTPDCAITSGSTDVYNVGDHRLLCHFQYRILD